MTAAQLQQNMALLSMQAGAGKKGAAAGGSSKDAHPVNAANAVKSVKDTQRDLEKQYKGAKKPIQFSAYQTALYDAVKEENSGLKKSQVEEECFKLWQRSPLNPKNMDK